jgi:chaperone required for assembly of F1-ATPase
MSGWAAKRFWREAVVRPAASGWEIALDGRPVKTPAKAALILPARALAEAIAAEGQAQEGEIRPASMPLTRAANSAIDKVAPDPSTIVAELARYGESDLLCYRAEGPEALVLRQAQAWDAPLAWAAETMGAPLGVTHGIVHLAQPPESLARLRAQLAALDAFRLTALSGLVSVSGSLVLGLAALKSWEPPEAIWARARIDEAWQTELWGQDDEAEAAALAKKRDFLQAIRFLELLDHMP